MNTPLLTLALGLSVAIAPALAEGPATAPTTQADPVELAIARDLEELRQQHADLPTVRIASLAELVSIRLQQGRLIAGSSIQASSPVRVVAGNFDGFIRFTPYGQPDPRTGERHFMVLIQQVTRQPLGRIHTFVASSHGQVQIARDGEVGGQTFSIQLIQDGPSGADPTVGQHAVRLLVTAHDDAIPDQRTELRVGATDFDALRREHPIAVQAYLRPIIRELGQEQAVFAVDDRVAWQVLGGSYQPTADDTLRVKNLVARLDSVRFQEREAAIEELTALDQRAALVLSRLDRSGLSPEAATSIDTFLASFAHLDQEEAQRLAQSPLFLLDAMNSDDVAIRTLAWRQLATVLQRPVDFNPDANEVERSKAISRLLNELAEPRQPATHPDLP